MPERDSGTVGGTPVQNVGAYGQEVSQTVECVAAIEIASGKKRLFTNSDCEFAYRASMFNTRSRGCYVLLRVRYRLEPGGSPTISYRDLKERFAAQQSPSLAETRKAVREIRHSKAMLIVPGDDDCRSAGSFFKNPIVDCTTAESVARVAEQRGLHLTTYPAGMRPGETSGRLARRTIRISEGIYFRSGRYLSPTLTCHRESRQFHGR